MKEFVLDASSELPVAVESPPLALRERVAAFVELTKPRITFLIVLTSAAKVSATPNQRACAGVSLPDGRGRASVRRMRLSSPRSMN